LRRRWIIPAAISLLLLPLLGVTGYWAWLGYFSSDPFVAVPATRAPIPARKGVVAVILSGDMGIRIGMGPKVAARLAQDGIPVVGVNSLTYFRQKRTPCEAAALIEEAMRRALAMAPGGPVRRVALIGQSFGADMVNVGSPKLAPEWRDRVLTTELVVPTNTINFRASPAELLNWTRPDASALPSGRALGWVPTVCIYGREEAESLCPHLHQAGVQVVALPGGHFLNKDVNAVHAALLKGIDEALSASHRTTTAHREIAR